MLREDKTARIERIPGKVTGFFNRKQLPDEYEFSVGKYTRSGNLAVFYSFRRLEPGEERNAEVQPTQPVLMMNREGTHWWWYLNRFWKDDDNLDAQTCRRSSFSAS